MFKRIEDEKPEIDVVRDEQDLVGGLTNDPRWGVIVKVIDQRIEFLKQLVDPLSGNDLVDSTDSVETVGFKFLIASTVIKYLNEIKNYPKLISDAVEDDRKQ